MPGDGTMPFASTVDMNMVLGDAMRGRQLPHVDPQAASMGWPQLGQGCSSVLAGAAMDALRLVGRGEIVDLAPSPAMARLGRGAFAEAFATALALARRGPFFWFVEHGKLAARDDRFAGGDGQTPIAKISST
jgi:hypothetical protein